MSRIATVLKISVVAYAAVWAYLLFRVVWLIVKADGVDQDTRSYMDDSWPCGP